MTEALIGALDLDDAVIGGNVNKLDVLPPGCRAGDNALAFRCGFLPWKKNRCGDFAPGERRSGGKRERKPRKAMSRKKKKLLKVA
jgi:hypothetical protein